MRHLVCIVFAMQITLLLGCGSSTMTDQQQLRKHFKIASNTEMLEFSASPPNNGWQREGLKVQAIFQLSKKEMDAIIKEGHKSGWRNLPIPDRTIVKLPFTNSVDQVKINIPFNTEGMFLCKTVGDNVLYASESKTALCENQAGTLHCTEAMSLEEAERSSKCKRRFGDQILEILEFNTQKLYVFIGSTY
jgi:hypothetical protein